MPTLMAETAVVYSVVGVLITQRQKMFISKAGTKKFSVGMREYLGIGIMKVTPG